MAMKNLIYGVRALAFTILCDVASDAALRRTEAHEYVFSNLSIFSGEWGDKVILQVIDLQDNVRAEALTTLPLNEGELSTAEAEALAEEIESIIDGFYGEGVLTRQEPIDVFLPE